MPERLQEWMARHQPPAAPEPADEAQDDDREQEEEEEEVDQPRVQPARVRLVWLRGIRALLAGNEHVVSIEVHFFFILNFVLDS